MSSTEYRLQPIHAADQAVLWDAIYHAIFVPPGELAPPRDVVRERAIARYVVDWGQADDVGLMACGDDDTPIGAAWLRCLRGEQRGFGYVDDATPELAIAVSAEWSGRGIGTRLLRALLEEAERHFAAVSLSVSRENPARRLYERFGFETVAETDTSLTMRRVRPS